MGKNFQQIVADTRLVVIHITGGKNRDLARRGFAVFHRECGIGLRRRAEFCAVVFGQHTILVDAQHTVHDLAYGCGFVRGIDHLHHHRNRGQLAQRIGARQQLVAK